MTETISHPDPDSRVVAEFKGVHKTYYKPDGSVLVRALNGVDLRIRQGEYVAIMGASGSGKSTMMNIVGCLDRPTSGTYMLDDRDVSQMDDDDLSRVRGSKIGFVFQAFNLISELTIVENVAVPLFYQGTDRDTRDAKARSLLERVGLGDRLGHRPAELSGGQQQRVAIARSLANDPAIILADEPTGNLDSRTGEAVMNLFTELHESGMTIIMVTHDDGIADYCERIVRLRDGMVEFDQRHRASLAGAVQMS